MSAQTPPPLPPAPPVPPVAPVAPVAAPDAPTLPYGTAPLVAPAAPALPGSGAAVSPYGAPAVAGYGATAAAHGYGSAPAPWVPPVTAPQNVLAWVAFGLGLGALLLGPLSSVAAIVCGHIARSQIRRTGEQGAGAALTGLIFGYVLSIGMLIGIVLYVLFFVAVFAGAAYSSGVPSSL
ncbi:DUF4190 domain-containing protein [Agromyces sp. M3QZ16-3]|uniref:DUF4190 domain-containing protein n=1 Tax=Agromyces sp. M3QZ16-3 TaxID=3447585 RepID=UPI003F68D910